MVVERKRRSKKHIVNLMKKTLIGWDLEINVPVFGAERGFQPVRDVWIMGTREKEEIAKSLSEKSAISRRIIDRVFNSIIVAHRIPAPLGEYAIEVWGHGLRLLSAEIEPSAGNWRIYPTGALASILHNLGVEAVKVESRRRLKGSKVQLETCGKSELCLIKAGNYVGFASITRYPNIYKVRDLAPAGFKALRNSTREEFAQLNKAYIERIAAEAREFIRQHVGNTRHVYVAVSGGADSTAAAILAVEALGTSKVRLVYADTGMEFPESRETVERLASYLGVKLDIVKSRFDPIREIARRGLMTRNNRWCTRILKLEPLREYYRVKNASVIIDGSRSFESWNRALNERVGVNPAIPQVKRILPILYWTRIEVQAFLQLRKAPINPLYEKGLSRIGCIMCPAMTLNEIRTAYSLYPEFYELVANTIQRPGVHGALEFLLSGRWRKF